LKPLGVVTSWVALSSVQPSASPLMFSGRHLGGELAASSSTALMVSASTSACWGMALNSR
jgi:hypothetical protein